MINKQKVRMFFLNGMLIFTLVGCLKNYGDIPDGEEVSPTGTQIITPTIPITQKPEILPKIANVEVIADSSYEELFTEDPYSQISKNTIDVYHPDQALYNYLFETVRKIKTSVSITDFSLTERQIMDTCSSLYEQAGLQLYYLDRVKWSSDYKTVNFTYLDTVENVKNNQNIFYSQINHVTHNVAPLDYSTLQRFFFIYEYITVHADYTDNMSDVSTYSAYSILVKQKGICGGFSILADTVLNRIGIPTEYISNEPHAWNIVSIDGIRYQTDFTWGAGSAYNHDSNLNTILMDDTLRKQTLDYAGFGDYPIILGYPRADAVTPKPCTDTRFNFYQYLYQDYALDIENDWIYYSDADGIWRMHLDTTEREVILSEYGELLACFEGKLYYRGEDPTKLYRYTPGQTPVVLDDTTQIATLKIVDGILVYGVEGSEKQIDLNEFQMEKGFPKDINHLPPVTLPKHKTFQIKVTFAQPMDQDQLPKQFVGLKTEEGRTVPIHMIWDQEGTSLTIRPKTYINDESGLTVYLLPGITSQNGQKTTESYDLVIQMMDE